MLEGIFSRDSREDKNSREPSKPTDFKDGSIAIYTCDSGRYLVSLESPRSRTGCWTGYLRVKEVLERYGELVGHEVGKEITLTYKDKGTFPLEKILEGKEDSSSVDR